MVSTLLGSMYGVARLTVLSYWQLYGVRRSLHAAPAGKVQAGWPVACMLQALAGQLALAVHVWRTTLTVSTTRSLPVSRTVQTKGNGMTAQSRLPTAAPSTPQLPPTFSKAHMPMSMWSISPQLRGAGTVR